MRTLTQRALESLLSIALVLCLMTGAESVVGADVARALLGPKASEAEVARLRSELGIDQSFLKRVQRRVKGLVQGDLGQSYSFRRPVLPIFVPAVANTLALVLPALILGTLLGLAAGTWAAHRPSPSRRLLLTAGSSFALLPSLIICTWVVYGLGYQLRLLSPSPALALAILTLVPTAIIAQTVFQELSAVFRSDYVRALRGFGFPERSVVMYSLRPAAIAISSSFTNLVLYLLVSTTFVEITFSFSGLGTLLLNATDRLDYPILMAIVLLVAVAFGLLNILSALVVYAADPRTR
jgi:peptide/nickel transport system permease protein